MILILWTHGRGRLDPDHVTALQELWSPAVLQKASLLLFSILIDAEDHY